MALVVSEEAIRATTKCPHDFQCLDSEGYPLCPGKHLIPGGGLFIEEGTPLVHDYKLPFGHGYICKCPTRIEVFACYKV